MAFETAMRTAEGPETWPFPPRRPHESGGWEGRFEHHMIDDRQLGKGPPLVVDQVRIEDVPCSSDQGLSLRRWRCRYPRNRDSR